jgi:hypothetical protein
MATLVYTNAYVSIDSHDLSDHVKSVTLNYEAELLDDTVMGTAGTRSNKPGLKNWSLEVEFLQDYAASSIDSILFALVGANAFPVAVRPVNGAIATDNPEYSGQAVLESYPPLVGEVGALGMATASFKPSGVSCNLSRDDTP